MRSVFNHLLAGLCTADLAFCLSCLAVTPVALGRPDLMVPWVHALAEAASHLALTASVLLTTALAVERHQVGGGLLGSPLRWRIQFKFQFTPELMKAILWKPEQTLLQSFSFLQWGG